EAEKVLRDLAAFWKTKDANTYTTQLGLLGLNLLDQKKYRDAEGVLRECLEICQKRKQEHWTTFNLQSLLGGALLGQKRYKDAEPLLLNGYKGMKEREARIPKKGRFVLIQAVERLIQLYDAWGGKPDGAAKWRAELEALRRTDQKPEPPKNKQAASRTTSAKAAPPTAPNSMAKVWAVESTSTLSPWSAWIGSPCSTLSPTKPPTI